MPEHKAVPLADLKALNPAAGIFGAVVSVFGNVDSVGDRVVPGAFKASLARWQASHDPIPVIWPHQWDNPEATSGSCWRPRNAPRASGSGRSSTSRRASPPHLRPAQGPPGQGVLLRLRRGGQPPGRRRIERAGGPGADRSRPHVEGHQPLDRLLTVKAPAEVTTTAAHTTTAAPTPVTPDAVTRAAMPEEPSEAKGQEPRVRNPLVLLAEIELLEATLR